MKKLIIVLLTICGFVSKGQELYPNSEPASIIPKRALGIRLMNEAYQNNNSLRVWNGAMFMYGVSSKLMFNAMVTGSNHHYRNLPDNYVITGEDNKEYAHSGTEAKNNYLVESVNAGFRYRFFNADADHRHFRMAVYGNGVYANRPHDEAEVSLMGDNKALGGGLIATVLNKKLAVSFTGGVIKPFGYTETKNKVSLNYGYAYNYSLSFGYLLLPFKYKSFNQTNLNLYAEFLGKTYDKLEITKNGNVINTSGDNAFKAGNYIEFRPAVQFIVKSNLRIDCSTAISLVNQSYIRKYPMFLLNVQYYFFL